VKDDEPFVPKVILRKIAFGDIGAGVRLEQVPIVGCLKFHPKIGKIVFDDIQRDIFNNRDDLSPQEVVACIVKALGKKIARKVMEDVPRQIKAKSTEMAKKTMGKGKEAMKKMGASVKNMFRKKSTDSQSDGAEF